MADNQFFRDASGRLTFEMFHLPCDRYTEVCRALASAFRLVPYTPCINGLDLVFQDYERGDTLVNLSWDNWSGFIVTAANPAAEPLVHEMAAYLLASPWAVAGF